MLYHLCAVICFCAGPISGTCRRYGTNHVLGVSHRESALLYRWHHLAFCFQDNRAFCKYICPVTVFLKPMSYDSLLRIKCDKSKCISCGKCKRVCPMDVDITDNSRKREIGTSCILFCTYPGIILSAGIGADCRKNRSLSRAMDNAYRDFRHIRSQSGIMGLGQTSI